MTKKILLVTRIIAIALVAVVLVLLVMMFINSDTFKTASPEALASPIINGFMYLAYIALAIAVVVTLIFPIVQMISNPKSAIKALIGIGVVVILGFVCYFVSSNELTVQQLEKYNITENTSVLVGAGIYLAYVILALTVVATIFMSVRGNIKK